MILHIENAPKIVRTNNQIQQNYRIQNQQKVILIYIHKL